VPCDRLGWPSRQLLSAHEYIISYRIVSYRIVCIAIGTEINFKQFVTY